MANRIQMSRILKPLLDMAAGDVSRVQCLLMSSRAASTGSVQDNTLQPAHCGPLSALYSLHSTSRLLWMSRENPCSCKLTWLTVSYRVYRSYSSRVMSRSSSERMTRYPLPFKCIITPRSNAAAALIRHSVDAS